MTGRRWLAVVAGIGMVGVWAGVQLAASQWNPTVFVKFGNERDLAYASTRLGPNVFDASQEGHDGKLFYFLAHDPLLTSPAELEPLLDVPRYRAQRVLFPLLLRPALLLGEWWLVWWMLGLNLLAVGLGVAAVGHLATGAGLSHWWGLAFALNPGVIDEISLSGSGVLAYALAFGGMAAVTSRHDRWAAFAFAGAGLAREVALLVGLAVALWIWQEDRRRALRLILPGLAAVAGWAIWVGQRLSGPAGGQLGPPFRGVAEAARVWIQTGRWLPAVLAGIVVAAAVIAWRRRWLLTAPILAFALLAPFLIAPVWLHSYDISRAMLPVFSLLALAVAPRRAEVSALSGK